MGGRRSNGEGSLRRVVGRNLYQYRWTEWVDQEAVRRVDYAKTRALAVTELRRATMRAAAGRVGADSTAPLRVVAARWESRAGVAQRLAPSTVKAYSGVLHRHVLPRHRRHATARGATESGGRRPRDHGSVRVGGSVAGPRVAGAAGGVPDGSR